MQQINIKIRVKINLFQIPICYLTEIDTITIACYVEDYTWASKVSDSNKNADIVTVI